MSDAIGEEPDWSLVLQADSAPPSIPDDQPPRTQHFRATVEYLDWMQVLEEWNRENLAKLLQKHESEVWTCAALKSHIEQAMRILQQLLGTTQAEQAAHTAVNAYKEPAKDRMLMLLEEPIRKLAGKRDLIMERFDASEKDKMTVLLKQSRK
ncbi:hypothetical protein EsH8_V_000906 [Colletotrichum jinshuiense]